MPVEGDYRPLYEAGLTTYDAKVFITIVKSGPLSALEASKLSNVPYPKVYQSLKRLMEMGWIRAEEGRPKKYIALSPEVILERYRAMEGNKVKLFEDFVKEEIVPFYEAGGSRERFNVWLVRGRKGVLDASSEVLLEVKNEAKIALPHVSPELIKDSIFTQRLIKHLREASIKVLVEPSLYQLVKEQLPRADVKQRQAMFGGGAISDSGKVIIILPMYSEELVGIVSNHPYVAAIAEKYFEFLWEG